MRPMLACKDASRIRYPVMASYKLDGIRALVKDGVVLSRTLKPIPNPEVQRLYGRLEGYDGELIVGEPYAHDVMQRTTSEVMRKKATPGVRVDFYVFDLWNLEGETYESRYLSIGGKHEPAARLEHRRIENEHDLQTFETAALHRGYEGIMVRDPMSLYKFGRSTAKEGGLVKVKRFDDDEARCVGVVELLHNHNEATENELGLTKRSTAKAGKAAGGTLGALVCENRAGVRFEIGTGFTAAQRAELWANPPIGQLVKYKHFAVTGVKDKPRFPVFLGFRDPIDHEPEAA